MPTLRLVAVITPSELVFVPGVGFRSSASATLVTPVTAERGEWSVTIERLLRSPDKTELVFSLTGPGGPPMSGVAFQRPEPPPWMHLPISLRHAGGVIELTNEGRQGPSGFSAGAGSHLRTIHPTVRFPPLPPGTMELEVVFDGAPGNWAVPLTLSASTRYGLPAKALEVADSHHGVTLTSRGVARSDTTTAVDIYASLEATPEPRFMRSLGLRRHRPADEPDFTLTDDLGGELREFAVFDDEVAIGRELHQVLVFPALDPNARRCVLTIADVVLAEHIGSWTTLAVPSESAVRFGTFDVRATVTKVQSRRGPAVRVFLDDGGWRDDRRLLYPESVWVNGRHGGIGWDGSPSAGEPCGVNAENPEDDANEVKIENPVVRLRGPWRLELDL
jgi:hypothetical protein